MENDRLSSFQAAPDGWALTCTALNARFAKQIGRKCRVRVFGVGSPQLYPEGAGRWAAEESMMFESVP